MRLVATAAMRLAHRPWRAIVACALLACVATPAWAGDCTVTTSPVSFGQYDPVELTSSLTANGNVRVACSPTSGQENAFGVPVTIALSTGSSNSYAARTMRQPPSSTLQYNLYTTPTGSVIWGNGSSGTQTVSGRVGGNAAGWPNPRNFPVYGRAPNGQDPDVSSGGNFYLDTITVTVTF